MSQILHIHHTNEVWHIQADLCALQHISLEDFPPLGLPAHLTCSSLHIPPSPTAILLFFCWHLSVRLAFDTLSILARGGTNTGTQNRLGCTQCHPKAAWLADARMSVGWALLQWKEPNSSETAHFKEESLLQSEASLMHLSSRQTLSTSERMTL